MLSLNRTVRTSAILALSAGLAGLVACGSPAGSTTGTGGTSSSATTGSGGGATTTTATTGSTGGSAPVCPGPGFGGGEKLVPGGSVTATIVDQDGAPMAAGQPLYICGIDICSDPAKTGANGAAALSTTLMMKKPAFKFGDAITYAELAIPLSMMSNDFMKVGTAKLPAAGPALTAGADAVSGGVTVSVPAGGSVGINELVYDTPAKQQFRAASIPIASAGPVLAPITFTDGGAGFSLLFGLAPSETLLCPAAKVKVALPNDQMMPNNLGWLPNAAVEFWVMTIDVGQEYAPYGGWAKASDGAVSADATSVSTSDSGGFIFLQTFGVRLKP